MINWQEERTWSLLILDHLSSPNHPKAPYIVAISSFLGNLSVDCVFEEVILILCWSFGVLGFKRKSLLARKRWPFRKHFKHKFTEKLVKAPNFGPHGNFELFLAMSVASEDESCTENEQNRSCRSNVFLQLLFSSFFRRTRFGDSKLFYNRGPKFP
jgi:hypothetical protein